MHALKEELVFVIALLRKADYPTCKERRQALFDDKEAPIAIINGEATFMGKTSTLP